MICITHALLSYSKVLTMAKPGIKCACEFCVVCALLKHKMSYYGPGSVPQLGNKGHHPGCSKYSAKKEDRRYLTPAARNRVKVEKKEADGDSNGEE